MDNYLNIKNNNINMNTKTFTGEKVNDDKARILRYCVLGFVLITCMVLISQFIGLGKAGFDSSGIFKQFTFYVGPGIGFLIGIFFLFVIEILTKKGDNTYGSSLSFNDPAEAPALPVPLFKKWFKLLLLSIILCCIIGLLSLFFNNANQQFFGLGTLEQQFTLTDSIIYNASLIPASENLGAAFFFALVFLLWRNFCRKHNVAKWSFWMVIVLLAIVVFITYGVINHQLRYQFDEVAIQNVIMIWGIGGVITVLTGSFIPFWVLHTVNNIFVDLQSSFASDIIRNWTIGVTLALIVIYILLYVRRKPNR